MNHPSLYQTRWCKVAPLTVAFDDNIFFEALASKQQFQMRYLECSFLMERLYANYWTHKISPYIQILQEWTECVGFQYDNRPSVIHDLEETIAALKLVKGEDKGGYGDMSQTDLDELIHFLERHRPEGVCIFLE